MENDHLLHETKHLISAEQDEVGLSSITHELIRNPVVMCVDGHVEDSTWVEEYKRQGKSNCPQCRQDLVVRPVSQEFWNATLNKIRRDIRQCRIVEAPSLRVIPLDPVTKVKHYVYLDVSTSMILADGLIPIPIPFFVRSRISWARELIRHIHSLLEKQSERDHLTHEMTVFVFGGGQPTQVYHDNNEHAQGETLEDVLSSHWALHSTTCVFDTMKSAVDRVHSDMQKPTNRDSQFRLMFITDGRDTNSLPEHEKQYRAWIEKVNELQLVTAVYNADRSNSGDGNIAKKLVYKLDEPLRKYELLTGDKDIRDLAIQYSAIERPVERQCPYMVISDVRQAEQKRVLEHDEVEPRAFDSDLKPSSVQVLLGTAPPAPSHRPATRLGYTALNIEMQ